MLKFGFFLLLTFVVQARVQPKNSIKLTNIECQSNPNWSTDPECKLKMRDRKVLLYARTLLTKLVEGLKIRVQAYRWHNGYHPYMFDFSFDICQMMKAKNDLNPITRPFWNLIVQNSNVNHTCPYSGELLVPMLEPDLSVISTVFPPGTYRLTFTFVEKHSNEFIYELRVKGIVSSGS